MGAIAEALEKYDRDINQAFSYLVESHEKESQSQRAIFEAESEKAKDLTNTVTTNDNKKNHHNTQFHQISTANIAFEKKSVEKKQVPQEEDKPKKKRKKIRTNLKQYSKETDLYEEDLLP